MHELLARINVDFKTICIRITQTISNVIKIAKEPDTEAPISCWLIEAQYMPINTAHCCNLIISKSTEILSPSLSKF